MPAHRHLFAIAFAAALVGCENPLVPESIAGTYDLRTVNDVPVPLAGLYTQVSGRVTLTDEGRFERRITYRIDSAGTLRELVHTATCRVRGSSLETAGPGDGPLLRPTWRRFGDVADGRLTIRIPLPADGYDVEVYERR